jgi:hypothetical protein
MVMSPTTPPDLCVVLDEAAAPVSPARPGSRAVPDPTSPPPLLPDHVRLPARTATDERANPECPPPSLAEVRCQRSWALGALFRSGM